MPYQSIFNAQEGSGSPQASGGYQSIFSNSPSRPSTPTSSPQPVQSAPYNALIDNPILSAFGKYVADPISNIVKNLPEAHFADNTNFFSPVGFVENIAQGLINTPSQAFKGAADIGEHLAQGDSTTQQVVGDVAAAAQLPLLFLTGGTSSIAKQGVTQTVKSIAEQGVKGAVKGVAKNIGIGSGFGLLGGLQSGKDITNTSDYLKNLLENVGVGAVTGGILGTVTHAVVPLAKGLSSELGAIFIKNAEKAPEIDHINLSPKVAQSVVLDNSLENTTVGKALLKESVTATNNDNHVSITPTDSGKYTLPTGEKVDISNSPIYEPKNQTGETPVENKILTNLTKEATSPIYSSAESFAQEKFGTGVGSLIGEIDPAKVTARDPIDQGTVNEYKAKIQAGKPIDPIMATAEKGIITTTDGSQRITAYQQLGQKAPIIISKYDTPVEGLKTVGDFYRTANKGVDPIHQELKKVTEVKTPDDKVLNPIAEKLDAIIKKNEDNQNAKANITENSNPKDNSAKVVNDKATEGSKNVKESSISNKSQQTDSTSRENSRKPVTESANSKGSNSSTNTSSSRANRNGQGVTPLKPQGTGDTKVSTLGLRVEQTAIERKLTNELGNLPDYKQMNMKEQAQKAADLLTKDPEKALRIAMGEETAPKGLLPQSVFKAMENSVTTPELANKLAHSPLVGEGTALGQAIKALDVKTSDSPVEAIKQVIDARQKAIEEKLGKTVNQAINDTVKEAQAEIKKVVADKSVWSSFVKEIQCK